MFFGHGVGQDERRGGETHVHAPGDDDGADEGLRPVVLVNGRCGDEDRADGEGGQRDGHHPCWAQPAEQQACCDGGKPAGYGDGAAPRGGLQGGGAPQLLVELPDVVHPDAEAAPSAGYAGEDEGDVGG